jgi:hypothetical protein
MAARIAVFLFVAGVMVGCARSSEGVVRVDLVIQPDDEVGSAVKVIKRATDVGELLQALAVFDGSHLHECRNGGSVLALKDPCAHEPGIGFDFAEHRGEALECSGLLFGVNDPDMDQDGTFVHRRASLSRLNVTVGANLELWDDLIQTPVASTSEPRLGIGFFSRPVFLPVVSPESVPHRCTTLDR